jgi:hypothetical protein
MSDCSYILINVEHQAAYIVGICILAVYFISLLMVPVWSTKGVVMRFVLTPKFEERSDFASQYAIEKRVFEVGDSLMWESKISAGAVGAVQSTSVSSDNDLDESGNFVAFIRLEPNYPALPCPRRNCSANAILY